MTITMDSTLAEITRELASGGLALQSLTQGPREPLASRWRAVVEVHPAHRRAGQATLYEGTGADCAAAINAALDVVRATRSRWARADAESGTRRFPPSEYSRTHGVQERDPDEAWNEKQSGDAAERRGR